MSRTRQREERRGRGAGREEGREGGKEGGREGGRGGRDSLSLGFRIRRALTKTTSDKCTCTCA